MSSLAAWSYTSIATHWSFTGFNDATGVKTFGAPAQFSCDYTTKSVRMTDGSGIEFTSRQIIYTGQPGIKQGDMVLIGAHSGTPIQAGAFEVRSVNRFADTFEGVADDYEVAT